MASGNSGRGDRPATFHTVVSPEHDGMKGAAKAQVRPMAVEDIPAALELSTEAGWKPNGRRLANPNSVGAGNLSGD